MPHVTVTIAGRPYRMACGEGEERHLEELARIVDGKVGELRKSFGEIGDQRITVMAALTLADELAEARRRIAALEAEKLNLLEAHKAAATAGDDQTGSIAEALSQAAARIEGVSHELTSATKEAGVGTASK